MPEILMPQTHTPSMIPHEAAAYTTNYNHYPHGMGWGFPPLNNKDRMHPAMSDDTKIFGPAKS